MNRLFTLIMVALLAVIMANKASAQIGNTAVDCDIEKRTVENSAAIVFQLKGGTFVGVQGRFSATAKASEEPSQGEQLVQLIPGVREVILTNDTFVFKFLSLPTDWMKKADWILRRLDVSPYYLKVNHLLDCATNKCSDLSLPPIVTVATKERKESNGQQH